MQSPMGWSGFFFYMEKKFCIKAIADQITYDATAHFLLLCWSICTSICSKDLGLHMNI